MRFVTWSVWRLYRSGSLTAVGRELARYKLDFILVCKGVKWDKGGTVRVGNYFFVDRKQN